MSRSRWALASANARSAEATCSSNSSQFGAQCLGAVLDGAHGGFCAIKPGIGGTGYRQPFGCGTFFCKFRFGDAQPLGQLLPRRQLLLQRVLEALDRAELALKKLALKNAMAISPRIAIVRRISGPIR